MVAHAVTKAWQKSLEAPPSDGESQQPLLDREGSPTATHGWHRRELTKAMGQGAAGFKTKTEANDDEPPIRVDKRDHIIPRRAAVSSVDQPMDSLWTSHEFWMGIVIGAAIVFVIKTVLAVQVPFGVDWYGL